MRVLFAILLTISSFAGFSQQNNQKKFKAHTVAFYNLENLFDTVRDTTIYDEAFTPNGSYGWTMEKYNNKLTNMSSILVKIGTGKGMKNPPAVIGVCEIENRKVLEDLVAMPAMKKYNYGIVHYDSPDERGIDAALLYRKDLFKVTDSKTFRTKLPDEDDRTRDILLVSGTIDGEPMYFTVNHWPSRSGGEKRSMPNRAAAAKNLKEVISSIQAKDANAKIVSMGDFNDDPVSPSIAKILGAVGKKKKLNAPTDLFNPYWAFYKKGFGTTAWRDAWSLFDMHIITNSLVNPTSGFKFIRAGRYTPKELLQDSGRFKGYPKRTHSFGNYLNGYSDHFPVYIYIAKEVK